MSRRARVGAAAGMILAYLAVLAVDLEPLGLGWSLRAWADLGLVCLILMGPFLLAAAHVALILAWAESPGRAYASNLAGSAYCGVSLALFWADTAGAMKTRTKSINAAMSRFVILSPFLLFLRSDRYRSLPLRFHFVPLFILCILCGEILLLFNSQISYPSPSLF